MGLNVTEIVCLLLNSGKGDVTKTSLELVQTELGIILDIRYRNYTAMLWKTIVGYVTPKLSFIRLA
jgi:hypothetical protein